MNCPRDDDFDRDTWCLLGLPYDAVSMQAACEIISEAALTRHNCFFSTPNLNFSISALDDLAFRNTVINSELSLIDGMPLLWMARLLGTGLAEKVSGSDLFDQLCHRSPPGKTMIKVFLFGGEAGVAEIASEKINATESGITCAGFLNPGFGSIEDISRPEIINEINAAKADFLVVALGARKGQLWIDRNRQRLQVPVVSHLGAVVNFVAGNVKRAPVWMQTSGLEWVWRILQEPLLWKRYFLDGMGFTWLFFTRVLPYAVFRKLQAVRLAEVKPVVCRVNEGKEQTVIAIKGSCLHRTIAPLRMVFREASSGSRSIKLDLSEVAVVDGAFLGLCLMLLKQVTVAGGELTISGLNPSLVRIFRWNCVDYLL
jgi:N-acetylglucosaminyldiphosphoundecaprenol N-acetyl-beta-D-mannosaminyltransferase